MTFMLVRAAIVAAVVVGIALLVAVVVVVARRRGRLDEVRRAAAPLARGLGSRSGMLGAAAREASRHLDGRDGR